MTRLSGTVEGILFRNEENGFSVFVLFHDGKPDTVTGTFPLLREGDFLTVCGEFTEHDAYGEQFRAVSYELNVPQSAEEIETFLASGIVKGIGPKLARDIVDEFGAETLRVMEEKPEELRRVPGIGAKKAAVIGESFAESVGAQRTILFLQKYGIQPHLAMRIFRIYGDNTAAVLQSNPYRLIADVDGIGFLTADKIAQSMGLEENSRFRIGACVRYCLTEAGSEGHTFLPVEVLSARAAALLGADAASVSALLPEFAREQQVYLRDVDGVRAVYHPAFFTAEALVAGNLLILQDSVTTEAEQTIESEIAAYERAKGITLAQKQKQAAVAAINNGICVITGGPGTGKTTTLDCILHLFRRRGLKLALAAPTGRAAKRMTHATGEEAKTIHRLLEYTKTDETFAFKRTQANPVECDVCIIDEASMIDLFLMQALLEGLRRGTRLILVGDADQLPSVGAGNVLADVISSGVFPTVKLSEVFRQAGESMIVTNAHRINRGEMPLFNVRGGDFFLDRKNGEAAIASTVVDLCLRRLPTAFGLHAGSDIQVLSPVKKGGCGVIRLNSLLQASLNPPAPDKHECLWHEETFREGDKVMQIRNRYDREWIQQDEKGVVVNGTGVFNGDSGVIRVIDAGERAVIVKMEDGRVSRYEFTELDELTLAYAISVHKSQGCEFPVVVMALPPGQTRFMTRNLFYTAVTRAEKLVVLCGSESTVSSMVGNTDTQKRYSALALRLKTGRNLL